MEQYLAGLDELLTRCANAQDSETLRNVTSTLNTQYYGTANCVPALVEIIGRSPLPQVRQLAAVELRKRISKWWPDVDPATQETIRNQLLQITLNEQQELVRHSVARVVSSVANVDIPQNKWPSLIPFLSESCGSATASHREVGTYILFTLFEVIADFFMDNMAPLYELFQKSIVDPESHTVRVTTVKVLGKVAEFIEAEDKNNIKAFRDLLPAMVNVLEECLKQDDEEGAGEIFEVFDTLLMLDAPLLSAHLADLIRFFLAVGANQELSDNIRVMALSFLMWAAVYKTNKIRSLKLVGFLVEGLMPIGTEEDPEDADEESPSRLSCKVLNALATNMPPQQVFPVVMPLVLSYMSNPDAFHRKAGMMAFAVVVEGCADYMSDKLNDLLQVVMAGLQDPEIMVRRAACLALGCLAEEMPGEISEHHQKLLPLVFNLMNDANPEVTKHACTALDAILEGLGDEVVQYLPMLMEKLLLLLDSAPQMETKATVIAAIGSAGHAAGTNFAPYFSGVMPRLRTYMMLSEGTDQLFLRGVTTDSIGAIAEATGAETFHPWAEECMQLAVQQLTLDSPRLRECSYAFFGVLARVFGEQFAPYLPTVMPHILSTCRAEEKDESAFLGEIDLNASGFEDDDDAALEAINFNNAMADEKEFAVDALGDFFENTHGHFLPYVEESIQVLTELSYHIVDGVRKAVVGTMFAFLKAFHGLSEAGPWTAGLPVTYPVHENVQKMINMAMTTIMTIWSDEEDRMVVMQICVEIKEAIDLIGPAVAAEHVEDIARRLLEIFEKRSMCQQVEDDDELVDEDEEAESESLLIGAAADLVGALCKAIGEGFSSYCDVFLPLISKYYKKTKSSSERAMAIGCLGECITGVKSAITPHTERLLQLFLKGCADEDATTRSNSAFAVGILVTHSQINLSSQYPTLLTALHPLFSNQPLPNVTDNAAGAVARLALANPEALPLPQVLPTFLSVLPLKADFEENEPVFQFLFHLFRSNYPDVMNNAHLLQVFQHVLSDEEQLTPKTRAELVELLRALNSQKPELNLGSSDLARFL